MKSKRKTVNRTIRRKSSLRRRQNHVLGPLKLAHKIDLSNVRRSKRIADRKYPHESESVIFMGTVQPISSTFSLPNSESSITDINPEQEPTDNPINSLYAQRNSQLSTTEVVEYVPEIHEEQHLTDDNPNENSQEQLMQLEIVFEMRNNSQCSQNTPMSEPAISGAGDNIPAEPIENNEFESEGTIFQDFAAYILSVFGDDNTSNTD